MNPIVKSDVAIFASQDPERTKELAAKILADGAKRRVVQVHLSPAEDGRSHPLYFPIVEGEICPCCRQRIVELGDFDGNAHHTEDRAMEARLERAEQG